MKIKTADFLGKDSGKTKNLCDYKIIVTIKIQQGYKSLIFLWFYFLKKLK